MNVNETGLLIDLSYTIELIQTGRDSYLNTDWQLFAPDKTTNR